MVCLPLTDGALKLNACWETALLSYWPFKTTSKTQPVFFKCKRHRQHVPCHRPQKLKKTRKGEKKLIIISCNIFDACFDEHWDYNFFGFNWLIELWRFNLRRIGRFCGLHLMPLQKDILLEVWTEDRWAALYYKYCNKCICFANHADLSLSLPNNDSKRSVQVSYTSSVVCLHKFVHVSICL